MAFGVFAVAITLSAALGVVWAEPAKAVADEASGVKPIVLPTHPTPAPLAAASEVERDVLKWLNIARTEPRVFREALREMLGFFDAKQPNMYHITGDPVALMTSEGKMPVYDAMRDLRRLDEAIAQKEKKPLKALKFADGLNKAAQDHAIDQSNAGVFTHSGTDSSTPWIRIGRYGRWRLKAAENMGTGFNNGLDIVRQLIVDDGEPDRSHRRNILNRKLTRVGIAVRPHKNFGFVTVIELTGPYVDSPLQVKSTP